MVCSSPSDHTRCSRDLIKPCLISPSFKISNRTPFFSCEQDAWRMFATSRASPSPETQCWFADAGAQTSKRAIQLPYTNRCTVKYFPYLTISSSTQPTTTRASRTRQSGKKKHLILDWLKRKRILSILWTTWIWRTQNKSVFMNFSTWLRTM